MTSNGEDVTVAAKPAAIAAVICTTACRKCKVSRAAVCEPTGIKPLLQCGMYSTEKGHASHCNAYLALEPAGAAQLRRYLIIRRQLCRRQRGCPAAGGNSAPPQTSDPFVSDYGRESMPQIAVLMAARRLHSHLV